ncbi:hypothetical protein N7520_006456 [Penicillium odoratum]|uniref:uncharacterized protein n=1 Tax=Penicillium odoratum TaxID=1167516 RepID=UPI002546EEE7|nr:uncharacterized protein N7520_006456 [Penicillium odoratum]KAJ5759300.1 hypothetical protein N7520_006456 [Penicillium odoratum]
MNIETPPDDGWGNSSNWEYKQPQKVNATLPFRPNRNTNFLSDAHYFQLKNQARKKIIDDDLPNLRTPSQTVSNDSNLQELKDRQGWNDVFVASYNLARKNKSVSDAWTKPIERSAKKPLQLSEALLYRTRKITNPEGEFSQDAKFTGNVFEYTPKPPTTPEALCALYLKRRMKRDTIRNSISKPQGPEQKAREMELEKTRKKKEKEAKSGRSASQWIFENLIDLSCVPLFGVDLAAIIPYRFEELEKEVIERIKERYSMYFMKVIIR